MTTFLVDSLSFRTQQCSNERIPFEEVLEDCQNNSSTCKINTGVEYVVDESYRKSEQTFLHKYRINFPKEVLNRIHAVEGWENWKIMPIIFELLIYKTMGFFKKHHDHYSGKFQLNGFTFNHVATILVYPPKEYNNHEGGELVVYNDDNTSIKKIIRSNDSNQWKIVIMKLGIEHEVYEMLSGVRYVFKGQIYEKISN